MKNNRMRKLNGRLIALVMAVMTVFTVLPANVQAASNPYYSSQSVSDITPTDAKLNGSISNPSRTKITRCGYILYDAKGNQLSQKYDSINYTYTTFKAWFNMNKYYGKLKPGTTYKYKLFVMTSAGKYFYSKTASFTTAKLQSHSERMNAFIKDSRWKNGTAWDARKPKLSTYRSSGCCAYCADFVKYVYGSNNLVSGSKFTSVSKIKAGDVIYAASYYSNGKVKSQHWIVVIARNGNKLTTAEGNVKINGKKVTRVSSSVYSISGNSIKGFSDGKKFRYGFHYNYEN